MRAKGLKRKDFLRQGFTASQYADWVYRHPKGGSRGKQPSGPDAVRVAVWLEAPSEYLFGATTEFDHLPYWEVAARCSLEAFLHRTPQGRQIGYLRPVLEAQLASHREHAPKTVEQWARAADIVLLARRHHQEETRELDRLAGEQIALQFAPAQAS